MVYSTGSSAGSGGGGRAEGSVCPARGRCRYGGYGNPVWGLGSMILGSSAMWVTVEASPLP